MAKHRVRITIEVDVNHGRRFSGSYIAECAEKIAKNENGEVVYLATEDITEMKQRKSLQKRAVT